jgi:hypothetical protein
MLVRVGGSGVEWRWRSLPRRLKRVEGLVMSWRGSDEGGMEQSSTRVSSDTPR